MSNDFSKKGTFAELNFCLKYVEYFWLDITWMAFVVFSKRFVQYLEEIHSRFSYATMLHRKLFHFRGFLPQKIMIVLLWSFSFELQPKTKRINTHKKTAHFSHWKRCGVGILPFRIFFIVFCSRTKVYFFHVPPSVKQWTPLTAPVAADEQRKNRFGGKKWRSNCLRVDSFMLQQQHTERPTVS